MHRERSHRLIATLAVLALVYIFLVRGTGPALNPVGLKLQSPAPGSILPMDTEIVVDGRFTHDLPSQVRCEDTTVAVGVDGSFSMSLNTPGKGGMWILDCVVPGGRHGQKFARAYYIDPQPKGRACTSSESCASDEVCSHGSCRTRHGPVQRDGSFDVVREAGVLVLPETFFRKGYSNFVPMLEESLNRLVAAEIETRLAMGEIPKIEASLWKLRMGIIVEDIRLCGGDPDCKDAFQLTLSPEKPNLIRVNLAFEKLAASGQAYVKLGLQSPLLGVELSGRGSLQADVALELDPSGGIRASIQPDSFRVDFEQLCFKKICLNIARNGLFQQWLNRQFSTPILSVADEMDRVFGDKLGNLTGSATALGQELEYGVRLSALEVTADHSVAIVWDVAFKSDEADEPVRTIAWAGERPRPHSTRPYLLVSDRLSNYILYRLWAGGLAKGLPDEWMTSVRDAVSVSGYGVRELRLGMPPVLRPVHDEQGLTLLLPDVYVVLRHEDNTHRALRLHGTMPVIVLPDASNTSLTFLSGVRLPSPGESIEDVRNSQVTVECHERGNDANTIPCSADSYRFERLVKIALEVANGIRSAVVVPIPRPEVPAPHGQIQELGFTRIQLLQDAPGWIFIETDY